MSISELQEALEWQQADDVFAKHEIVQIDGWEVGSYRLHGVKRIHVMLIKWVPRAVSGTPYKQHLRLHFDLELDDDNYAPLTAAGITFAGVCVPGDEPHFCGVSSESARDHEPRRVRQGMLFDEETGAGGS